MLAKTGLLIVSNPTQIGSILSTIQNQVRSTLYIQLLSALTEPLGNFYPNVFTTWPKFSKTIFGIYSQAAKHCSNLDVHVLLSGIKFNAPKIITKNTVDLVIFDKLYNNNDVDSFIKRRVHNIAVDYNVMTLNSPDFDDFNSVTTSKDDRVCKHTVLGGTFDRFHLAHKVLLTEALLRSNDTLTVGVTEENMVQSKILWELIEDVSVRMNTINNFLSEVCPEIKSSIVKISDPFGPAITDPTMEMIIVSQETVKGGQKINEIRKERGLNSLDIVAVDLIDEPNHSPIEEQKISSSTARIRALGTLLRPIVPNNNIPKRPHVIGLTGGIASGKSGVARYLEEHGAQIINCDIIAHTVYKAGKPCHKLLVNHFGEKILADDGEIDRKVLGGIVFKNHRELEKLNSLVWPAIAEEVVDIIRKSDKNVVVIEAAVLVTAGWAKYCHEVWATLVPRDEAIRRLVSRNNLTEDEAGKRIDSQPANLVYVRSSNVVFCPLWDPIYTKQQVDRAWALLQDRILS